MDKNGIIKQGDFKHVLNWFQIKHLDMDILTFGQNTNYGSCPESSKVLVVGAEGTNKFWIHKIHSVSMLLSLKFVSDQPVWWRTDCKLHDSHYF